MKHPVANLYSPVELGKVEGFWSALQLPQEALAEYFNIEQQAHWLLIRKEPISYGSQSHVS